MYTLFSFLMQFVRIVYTFLQDGNGIAWTGVNVKPDEAADSKVVKAVSRIKFNIIMQL